MSVDTDGTLHYAPQYRRPVAARRTGYMVRKETLVRVLLTAMFYLTLWRATGMWYGYPAAFDEGTPSDPAPMRVLLYSLIPLQALYIMLEPRRVAYYVTMIPLPVWGVLFFCVGSLFYSIDFGASFRGLIAVGLLTTPPLLFRLRYGSRETFRILQNFCIVAAFANILYLLAFPQFAIMRGSLSGAVKGLFFHKNIMGQFSAVALIILFSFRWPGTRIFYGEAIRYAAFLILLVLLVLSLSSTAVVMFLFGVAILGALRIISGIQHFGYRSFIVLLGCMILAMVASSVVMGVAAMIAEAFGKDLTFSGRTDIWDAVIPLIQDRPILGYGFATFRQASIVGEYVILSHTVNSLHNTYIEMSLNIGLIGAGTWVFFMLSRIIRKITHVEKDRQLIALRGKEVAILILVMIGGMTEAGLMLAPVIFWPLVMSVIGMNTAPIKLPGPRYAGRLVATGKS